LGTLFIPDQMNKFFSCLSVICLISSCLFSCLQEPGARFIIVNQTGHDVDSLRIEPDGKLQWAKVPANDSISLVLDMADHPRVDGSYRLSFREEGVPGLRGLAFGYFSNGTPLESMTRIQLMPDTVVIVPYYHRY
jgi:hypothetical protein